MLPHADVIAAISTPLGKGGVSVIRISGEGAASLAESIFKPMSGVPFSSCPARMQIYGNIISHGEVLDDVLATRFNSGASYTGEEAVEISCHGGILITREVLEAVLLAGARAAEAGEFTRRAFINGRLSLTEAEAIGTLLDAKTKEQIKLSGGSARARLDEKISSIKRALTDLLSSSYARIDYPDEDLGDFSDAEYLDRLLSIYDNLSLLCATYRTGRAINEGINTVICGKPNVGKSTLYNLLAGEDAAIVTDISGTTRDVLERSLPLGRVMLNIADTAGIRDEADADAVEKIGIMRSVERIARAELIFSVFDMSRPLDSEDERIINELSGVSGTRIAIINKSDAAHKDFNKARIYEMFENVFEVSAKCAEEQTLKALTDIVDKLFTDERIVSGSDAIISSSRQFSSLKRAEELVQLAIGALKMGIPQDAVSSDIERALGAVAEVDGRSVSEDIVADIFSKFCVGK